MSANALYTALLAAQRSMGKVKKDAKNPAFRSNYATLQSILDTIEGPLWDNGLLVVQQFQYDRIGHDGTAGEGTPILITRLVHAASGDSIESVVTVSCKDPLDPQKVDSAITYYRRYSLLALLGLTPEEDDDGNAAAQPRQQATTRQSPAPRAPVQHRPAERAQEAPPHAPADYTMTDFWRETKQAGYGDPVALADYLRIATFKGYDPADLLTMFRDQQKKEPAQ